MDANDEIMRELRAINAEQARLAAEVKAHTELDTERFRFVNEKLAEIGVWSRETRLDVKSLLETRAFQKGIKAASVRAASLIAVLISGGFALVTWLAPLFRGGK